jgi:hypothetical protein
MIKLFAVNTKYDEYDGFKDVSVYWFVKNRPHRPLQPYEGVIAGYSTLTEPIRKRAEDFVDEFFTDEEAQSLVDYLIAHHDATPENTKINPIELPIVGDKAMPYPEFVYVGRAFGSNERFRGIHLLWPWKDAPNYPLPFIVGGLVDTAGCADISGCEDANDRELFTKLCESEVGE